MIGHHFGGAEGHDAGDAVRGGQTSWASFVGVVHVDHLVIIVVLLPDCQTYVGRRVDDAVGVL